MNTEKTIITTLENGIAVADTSALLIRGTDILKSLPKMRLILPAIVVSELEDKRSSETVGFLAREWLRLLESLRARYGGELSRGVEHDTGITIAVEPNHTNQQSLPKHLQNGSNDSTILAVANNLKNELAESGSKQNIGILSNDVPMRLHATLDLDLPAFEISSATIEDVQPMSGVMHIDLPEEETSAFYNNAKSVVRASLAEREDDLPSSFVATFSHNAKQLTSYLVQPHRPIREVPKKNRVFGVVARTPEQNIAVEYLQEDPADLPIVSIGGSAGTGKTLLTIAAGLQAVKEESYNKVIVFRSVHGMGVGQDIGLLPGAIEEKMAPWAGAIYDAVDVLAKIKTRKTDTLSIKATAEKLREDIEVSPIQYLRGRSISDTYIVLDEAQNFSRNELLNILARVGAGSKIVLVHDAAQVDNRFLQTGSRAEIWSVINSLKNSAMFAHITLQKTERSPVAELASEILSR